MKDNNKPQIAELNKYKNNLMDNGSIEFSWDWYFTIFTCPYTWLQLENYTLLTCNQHYDRESFVWWHTLKTIYCRSNH